MTEISQGLMKEYVQQVGDGGSVDSVEKKALIGTNKDEKYELCREYS